MSSGAELRANASAGDAEMGIVSPVAQLSAPPFTSMLTGSNNLFTFHDTHYRCTFMLDSIT